MQVASVSNSFSANNSTKPVAPAANQAPQPDPSDSVAFTPTPCSEPAPCQEPAQSAAVPAAETAAPSTPAAQNAPATLFMEPAEETPQTADAPQGEDPNKVQERLTQILMDQLKLEEDQVTLEANLIDDLGADSLDSADIALAIEKEFGISIPEDDYTKLDTVGNSVDYIKERLNGNPGGGGTGGDDNLL